MADETRNMGLDKPIIGVNGDSQDIAAQKINDNFDRIDAHDHTIGKGTPINVDGIDIDKNLPLNQAGLLQGSFFNFYQVTTATQENNLPPLSLYSKDNVIKFKNIDGSIISFFEEGATITPVNITGIQLVQTGDSYKFVFTLSNDETVETGDFSLDFTKLLSGTGAPSNTLGDNNNLYVDTETDFLYFKTAGAWRQLSGGASSGGGGLSTVVSDDTLRGDGSAETPLGVAVPYSQAEKNKLAGLTGDDLPVGASAPVKYSPSVIFHDPSRSAGNHGVALSEVIAQIEANNPLYTQRQSGSFVSAANFNPLTVETVTYGTITAKALVVTYNGNLFNEQQLIKLEFIDSTGELTKEYLFPPSTIQNGFDYVISDALANSSIHKKEVRVRIVFDSASNKTKIFIHQRPVSDPPPAVYLFIIALYNVESLSQKGADGKDGGLEVGSAFPSSPADKQTFWLEEDITNFKAGIYYYDLATTTWKPLFDSIGQQFHGRLNVNTIYKSNEIFDFDLTLIRVKPGATFQASVDAPTWSDTTWKALTDPRTGALNTKLELLTFPSALTDATVSGNSVVFKRANEEDKTITLPGGSVDITGKDKVTTLEDDDEYLLQDFSGGGEATLTTGTVISGGNPLYGWSVSAGVSTYVKGGSLTPNIGSDFVAIYSYSAGVGVEVKAGQLTTMGSIVINGTSYPLTKGNINVDGSSRWGGVNVDQYTASSAGNIFSASNVNYTIKILATDGTVLFGGTVRSGTQKKATHGQLKKEFGVNFDSLAAASTLEDDDEFAINDFSGGLDGATLVTGLIFSSGGIARYGWSFATGATQFLKAGSLTPEPPSDFIGILSYDGGVELRVNLGTLTNIGSIVIDGVSGSFNDVAPSPSVTSSWGNKGYDSYIAPSFGDLFTASNQTHSIKVLAKDGTILYSDGVRSATKKKVTLGKLKTEINTNFSDLPLVTTLEDDDEFPINDFSGGGDATLTTGQVENGIYGWSVAAGTNTNYRKGGSLDVTPSSDLIAIYAAANALSVWVKTGTFSDLKTIIIDGTSYPLVKQSTNVDGSTYWGGFHYDHYITQVTVTPEDLFSAANEMRTIKLLATDGTQLFGGEVRSAQKKKVTWGKLKGDIDASTNFAELEKVTTLEDDDELVLNDFSGGGDAQITLGVIFGSTTLGWSVAAGFSSFKKGGTLSDINSDVIAIQITSGSIDVFVKSGTLTNIGSVIFDGVSYPLVEGSTNIDGTNSWGGFDYTSYFATGSFSVRDGQTYNIKILNKDGTNILPNEQRTSKQKKGTLGQLKQNILQLVPRKAQTILTPEYLKARPNLARDEVRIDSTGTGTLGIGTDTFVDTDLPSTAYQKISIAVKKTDLVDAKFIEVFHAHAPQVLAASSGLRELSQFDATAKPFSGTFRSDRNYTMEIHRGQNQLGGHSSTTDRITFTANTTGGSVYIGEVRIWK